MDKPFSYLVYQKGLRFYQQSKVFNLSKNLNTIEAYVNDDQIYHVKLVFNSNKQLTIKKCNCRLAKNIHECGHMAALYVKVKQESLLEQKVDTLRDLYVLMISSKPKPNIYDYVNFEKRFLDNLQVFQKEKEFEKVQTYLEELEKLTYPVNRRNYLVQGITRAISELYHDPTLQDQMSKWIIHSLSLNRFQDYQMTFLDLLSEKDTDDFVKIADSLLANPSLRENESLCNKLLLMIYQKGVFSLEEFKKKYQRMSQCEVIVYLTALELLEQQSYSKVIELISNYHISHFYYFKKEIEKIYKKAKNMQNPREYMHEIIKKLYWHIPDMTAFKEAKNQLSDVWQSIKYDVYDELSEKIRGNDFLEFILNENEWEYALYDLETNGSIGRLLVYDRMLLKYCPELYSFIVSDVIAQSFTNAGSDRDYQYCFHVLDRFREKLTLDEFDYLIYYIRKINQNNEYLIRELDEMEATDELSHK